MINGPELNNILSFYQLPDKWIKHPGPNTDQGTFVEINKLLDDPAFKREMIKQWFDEIYIYANDGLDQVTPEIYVELPNGTDELYGSRTVYILKDTLEVGRFDNGN